jgi:hypothetical protein
MVYVTDKIELYTILKPLSSPAAKIFSGERDPLAQRADLR